MHRWDAGMVGFVHQLLYFVYVYIDDDLAIYSTKFWGFGGAIFLINFN